ncbi:MBL fold metallo-hydrolase [Ensifer sp. ENS03]|uniref:MBL fold metallo-hydrolase n=1 Tax=Ensifer sp. ENS03 TaxID=2769283 RepID=UPI00177FBB7B|nr:MBL fold metallo-hydrolase [Ensifer sp. ENS03]MBD9560650.1 MBL fold metallo-hydrolase [Ensifer sp. ENS03]
MPVGQGGFHVGALRRVLGDEYLSPPFDDCSRFGGADFLYVYDCGSSPKSGVEREIKDLLSHRAERRLDILFLSHFDVDHICGTPKLLGAKRKRSPGFAVDTIVLPYVDHAERFLAFARATVEGLDRGSSVPDFFRRMVIDPAEALSDFDPRQIIFVEGDEPPTDDEAGTIPDPDIGPWSGGGEGKRPGSEDGFSFKIEAAHAGTSFDRKETVEQPSDRTVRVRRLRGGRRSAGASILLVANVAFRVHDLRGKLGWRLLPHVRPATKAAVAAFEKAAEIELKWTAGSFRTKIANASVREEAVTKHRMKLARAYRAIFGKNKNLTSMSLYSGPANPQEADGWTIAPNLAPHHETKIGWMGTGDAPLKDVDDIATFEHFFSDDIIRVASFMFPHHGSIENSNPARLVSDADIYVAAADPRHDWEHPSNALRHAAYYTGKAVAVVREQRRTAFDECILVTWGEGRNQVEARLLQATCTTYVDPDEGVRVKLRGPHADRRVSANTPLPL